MSTQHTPGPWKAVRNASFWEVVTPAPGQTLDQADEYSQSIAYVWGQGEEQAVANARLIAAAPELLAAAQAAKLALDDLLHAKDGRDWWTQRDAAVMLIDAAIAKAKGTA